jgi:serine/threonine protein phosphatase 1
MLSRLFSRRSLERPPSRAPDGSRVYAIGDIHGCVGLLDRLHGLILDDAAHHPERRKLVVYLGDYIDRGPDSRAVVDRLLGGPLPGFESVFLSAAFPPVGLR